MRACELRRQTLQEIAKAAGVGPCLARPVVELRRTSISATIAIVAREAIEHLGALLQCLHCDP